MQPFACVLRNQYIFLLKAGRCCRWLLLLWLLPVGGLNAQDALRISMAGDLAAAQNKQAQSTIGYYNLRWGPVALRCGATEATEYDDNLRNSGAGGGDLIFRPSLNTQLTWPVTEWNTLNVNLSGGYSFYLQHSSLNQIYLNPGTGLAFDLYIKDWVINLHDRVTVSEYSYQNPTARGNQNNEVLQNDAGISGLWDLNQAVVNVGYDHMNYVALTKTIGQPDSVSENFFVNGGFKLRPEIMVGLESGLGLINYEQSGATGAGAVADAVQWNVGAFSSVQISQHLSTRLDAGYTVYTPNATGTNSLNNATALYFQFSITHQVNDHISYSLSAGHSVDFAYNGQAYDRYFVNLDPNWNVVRNFQISTPVWYEHGKQVAVQTVSYDQYGAGLTIRRGLTQKLSSSVYYKWIKETSNSAWWNYTENIVGLSFTYQF